MWVTSPLDKEAWTFSCGNRALHLVQTVFAKGTQKSTHSGP